MANSSRARHRPSAISGADIVTDARRYLGVPYQYGGTDRRTGLDCSGLILVVCEDLGIGNCPRTSEEQFAWAAQIDAGQAGPGDLVFFVGSEIDPPPGHVGIVVSPGQMINAPFTGAVVRTDNYSLSGSGVNKVLGFRRLPNTEVSRSSNQSVINPKSGQTSDQHAAAGTIGSLVAWVVVILLLILIIALFALAAWFTLH